MKLFNRAAFSDEFLRIDRKIQKLKSRVEDEFFKEYPEQANADIFYGSENRGVLFTVPCTPLQGIWPIKLRFQASSPSTLRSGPS